MPRVVKVPEERRRELLDCAQVLFFARGYDATTINDVIAAAGVSKGAFYHYFASKEALLEALAVRLAHAAVAQARDVLEDPSLDALTRLNTFLSRGRRMKIESAAELRATFDAVFRPENIVLYHRLNAAVIAVMTPVLSAIIAQGIAEGRFRVRDPDGTAEMLLRLGAATHDQVAQAIAASTDRDKDRAAQALEQRLELHGIAIDRILGLPDGSVRFVEPGFATAVLGARHDQHRRETSRRKTIQRARP